MKISPRLRRWLLIGACVVVVYALLGFLVAPPIARGQLERRASAALHRPVTVDRVRVNPFTMSVTIEGLKVVDHDGAELASWERMYANFDPLTSLFRLQWQLGDVHLVHPRQRLAIAKDGTLNIADLLVPQPTTPEAPPASTGKPAALPAVGIGLLRVENWEVDFTDQSRRSPFHTTAGPLTFELREFSTKPDGAGPYSFVGSSDTIKRFAWSGTISAVPIGSKGRIEVENVSLPPHMPFVEELFNGVIQRGRVSLAVNYEIAMGETPRMRVENSTFAVDDLGLGFRNTAESVVTWTKLEVQLTQADLLARTADVARVALTGFDAHVQRTADGTIDLLSWLPPPATETSTPAPTATAPSTDSAPAASVQIAEITLIDGRARITDHSTPRPGTLVLDQINVTALNAGTDLDREIKLDAKARWDGTGALSANGVVRVLPLAASLDVQGDGLTLQPLEPWIEAAAKVRITSGAESFRGHVEASQAPGAPLTLTWTGDSRVDNLSVHDGVTGGELLAWQSLAYTNTRFNLDPLEISVAEIALVAPSAHVTVNEDGTLNLTAILPPAPTATKVSAATESAPIPTAAPTTTEVTTAKTSEVLAAATQRSLPFAAKIDAITISGGTFTLADRSLPGGFSTALRDFGGSIKGLSSAELARADVDLAASLDGVAPLRIKGSINPLAQDRFSDVNVSFSNIDLPLFSPYSGKFIGKKIQKGKLRVDLDYKLSQNQLVAENRVLLDQFYLGENVESPDALKLPIGLALALLRDREGKITLDVPVRGNLDDPEFKYGRVVMQVIGNVITKAATAPFALLGGMFGGKEQDLSYVDFASGSFALNDEATGKLDVLAKSLYERPALRLEISSPPAPEGDRAGLQALRFDALLRAARTVPSEEPLAAEEMEPLVRTLFTRHFLEETAAAAVASGALPPTTPADAEPEERGLLSRIVGSIFGRGEKPAEPPPPPDTPAVPAPDAPPPLTLAEMQARLLETITLTDADFQELAAARAGVIRERLLADGKIEAERVFLVTEPQVLEGANTAVEGGRVFFGLE